MLQGQLLLAFGKEGRASPEAKARPSPWGHFWRRDKHEEIWS
jgi:hypothetical protein